MKTEILTTFTLSEDDKLTIKALAERLKDEQNLFYKLDPQIFADSDGHYHHTFHKENGELAGYVAAACFDGSCAEYTALATQKAPFHQMMDEAIKASKARGITNHLLIIDENDTLVREQAKMHKFVFSFSEQRMFLNTLQNNFAADSAMFLCRASTKDAPLIASFDDEENETLTEIDTSGFTLAFMDGEAVGRIRIDECDGLIGLYAFAVRKDLRGRGIGRKFLTEVITNIPHYTSSKIYLEVAVENAPARHLYTSMGFEPLATFEYYERK